MPILIFTQHILQLSLSWTVSRKYASTLTHAPAHSHHVLVATAAIARHVYRDEYFVDWDHMTEAQEEAAAAAAAEAQALLEAGAAAPELPRRQSNRKRRSGKEPARTPVRTPPRVERDSSPEVDDDVRIPSRLVLTAAQRKAKEMREKTIASTNMMLEELDQVSPLLLYFGCVLWIGWVDVGS